MNWTEYQYIASLIEAMKKVQVEKNDKPEPKPETNSSKN